SKRAAAFRRLFEACMAKGGPLTGEETEKYIRDTPPGSVALVGAGCGKADLITLRGLRLLRQCQAVVYDDLIDPALLDAAPESALRLYVGKRNGVHAASQAEINQKLIELAGSGLRVVRLKGGDPYLFGRGGEEMLALKAAGIPCQEVPGIPSAIGIAAEAGIPVTHRGVSRGVHIVTAHTADTPDGLPEDFDTLAKLSGTLVFLMGLERLSAIAARLMAAGKDGNTPGAVISGGNAPNPVRVRAPLFQLEQAAKDAGVSAPAIILIGDVADLDLSTVDMAAMDQSAMDLSAMDQSVMNLSTMDQSVMNLSTMDQSAMDLSAMPPSVMNLSAMAPSAMGQPVSSGLLKGRRIGVTGTREVAEKQLIALRALGAEAVWVLREEIRELPLKLDLRSLGERSGWLVFTSANGVKTFFGRIEQANMPLRLQERWKFAVIGAATDTALARYGIQADLCPKTFTSQALAVEIGAAAKPGEQIILLRSASASSVLPEMLCREGFSVEDISIYDVERETCADPLPALDYLTFSSAGGVKLFYEQYGAVPKGTRCVCIGGVTARALSQYTEDSFLMSEEISAEGIVESIIHDQKG
ncbi:MAG: uroporphyrinogen-III C-methyltransferase, partial [Acetatifactor sp.]|nr:uroporphyrinogen-III C-methyltransferase [Acetatifactor sp.]